MTTAQKISEQFKNDGQVFEDSNGNRVSDVCSAACLSEDWRDGYRVGDVVRYTFADQSVITISGDAWDFGCLDCYCWAEYPHHDCPDHDGCYVVRVVDRPTGDYCLSDDRLDHIDESGPGYDSEWEAIQAAKQSPYTHVMVDGTIRAL